MNRSASESDHLALIAEIEQEHELLFLELERFQADFDAAKNTTSRESVFSDFAGSLIGSALNHFRFEERVMRGLLLDKLGMEAIRAHIEAHANLMTKITDAVCQKALPGRVAALIGSINDWLTLHISLHDALLLKCLKGLGGR